MTFDADRLYASLPAVHRNRDAEHGYPLRQLLEVIAGQAAVLEENLAQLYDNHFVETADPWALSYIADLLGLPAVSTTRAHTANPRAEVGHTIAYRRRKGTATMLELLARDVTGWPARAVEYPAHLATTAHLRHVRRGHAAFLSLRDAASLAFFGSPFEAGDRNTEVRRIASGRGRWNIPNVGVHVWRLRAFRLAASPLVRVELRPDDPLAGRRFRIHPLGLDAALWNQPLAEEVIEHLAEPVNVPLPITRRMLLGEQVTSDTAGPDTHCFHPHPDFYAPDRSIALLRGAENGEVIPATEIAVADLSDTTTGWSHEDHNTTGHPAAGLILLDPELGRVVLPATVATPPSVTFFYAFSAAIGGGEYPRVASFANRTPAYAFTVSKPADAPPGPDTLSGAIAIILADAAAAAHDPSTPATGCVAICNNARHVLEDDLDVGACQLEVRAGDGFRPFLSLTTGLLPTTRRHPSPKPRPTRSRKTAAKKVPAQPSLGGPAPVPAPFNITGLAGGAFALNGFLVAGAPLRFSGDVGHIQLRHCTFATHLNVTVAGVAQPRTTPCPPSMVIAALGTVVEISDCILGPLVVQTHDVTVRLRNCIIDAGDPAAMALADASNAPTDPGPSRWTLENCTVIGRVDVGVLELASNTLFCGDHVVARRHQEGCVRFCCLPANSRVPRQYRCVSSAAAHPAFTSRQFGAAAYGQLSEDCPPELSSGGEGDAEMGAFHELYLANKDAYLRARLAEYLRFGLEAGVFHAT